MSAILVSERHILALITAGLADDWCPLSWEGTSGTPFSSDVCRLDHTCAESVGRMLWAENVRSVHHRYPERGESHADAIEAVAAFRFPLYDRAKPLGPVECLKLLDCYEYQASECEDWPDTEAFRFCRALRARLIAHLPGYEKARWTI